MRSVKSYAGKFTAVATAAAVVSTVGVVAGATSAQAHGAPTDPASRTYTCRFLEPNNELCQQAWNSNSQALYDWNEVNIGSAAGQHQSLIPDGQLCSAGRSKYAAFNTASDKWPVTNLTPDSDGKYTLKWHATAPHATSYYRVYVTKPSFNINAAPLKWSDLDLVFDSGQTGPEAYPVLRTSLPDRSSHAMLYTIWQRSDSPEAFYACNDVTINAAGVPTPTSSPTTPSSSPSATSTPTTSPTPTQSPTNPAPTGGVSVALRKTDEWGSGRNYDATVTNGTAGSISSWKVTLPWTSAVEPWNASASAADGKVTFSNASWNGNVASGGTASFGFTDRGYVPPNPQTCTAVVDGVTVGCTIVGASSPSPTPTTPTPTPTTASPTPTSASPTPTPTPTTASPSPTSPAPLPTVISGNAKATVQVTTDWGVGYCANVIVSTTSTTPIQWSVKVPVAKGKVTTLWEAEYSIANQVISATGKPWNNTVKKGQNRTFGFCAG